jgi:hypothetical protein
MIQIIGEPRKTFHYWRDGGAEFVQNGAAKIKVGTMDIRPSPRTVGRVIRFVVVREILHESRNNPNSIRVGSALALSLPSDKVNASSYRWFVDDPNEECMVPIKFRLSRENN